MKCHRLFKRKISKVKTNFFVEIRQVLNTSVLSEAFLVIRLCDKLSNAGSRFVDVLIVVEVNFFRLERADKSFKMDSVTTDRIVDIQTP